MIPTSKLASVFHIGKVSFSKYYFQFVHRNRCTIDLAAKDLFRSRDRNRCTIDLAAKDLFRSRDLAAKDPFRSRDQKAHFARSTWVRNPTFLMGQCNM